MQSYREEAASRPVTQLNPLPAPLSSSRPDDMSKYRVRYEEAMNPFEAFRGRVSCIVMLIVDSHR
jgi:homeobox protein cut-like